MDWLDTRFINDIRVEDGELKVQILNKWHTLNKSGKDDYFIRYSEGSNWISRSDVLHHLRKHGHADIAQIMEL